MTQDQRLKVIYLARKLVTQYSQQQRKKRTTLKTATSLMRGFDLRRCLKKQTSTQDSTLVHRDDL